MGEQGKPIKHQSDAYAGGRACRADIVACDGRLTERRAWMAACGGARFAAGAMRGSDRDHAKLWTKARKACKCGKDGFVRAARFDDASRTRTLRRARLADGASCEWRRNVSWGKGLSPEGFAVRRRQPGE
ncbi:hypothetical protein B5F40_03865 [Gordonibacter sp. An230]|nr:hypothetical protein B5F40_03865 [Gordonibacter sp. An230]